MNSALPKFYVGQKVVCINDTHTVPIFCREVIKKETVLTVRKVYGVCIFFNEVTNQPQEEFFPKEDGHEAAYHTKDFAPIHENFQAITFEKVLEKELASVN